MTRVITINGRTGRFDVPSFLWTENESLTIKFQTSETRNGKYVAIFKLGKQKKTVWLGKDMLVELPAEWLRIDKNDVMETYLELRTVDGTRTLIPSIPDIGGYYIEPLLIECVNEAFTARGWMSTIELKLNELNKRLGDAEIKLKAFEDEGVPLPTETEEQTEQIQKQEN